MKKNNADKNIIEIITRINGKRAAISGILQSEEPIPEVIIQGDKSYIVAIIGIGSAKAWVSRLTNVKKLYEY